MLFAIAMFSPFGPRWANLEKVHCAWRRFSVCEPHGRKIEPRLIVPMRHNRVGSNKKPAAMIIGGAGSGNFS
jgi:hypothetical protein